MSAERDDAAIRNLLEQIRRRTQQEAAPHIAPDLMQHFVAPVDEASRAAAGRAHAAVRELRAVSAGLPAFQATSRLPGGALLHRLIGRSVRRDTGPLAERIDLLIRQVADVIEGAVDALIELDTTREAEYERLRRVDRERQRLTHVGLSNEVSTVRDDLQRLYHDDIAELQEYVRLREFRPDFSNIDYTERFRGTREDLLVRYHDVADVLVATGGPVLDLGCGRGELVELVMAKGGHARGVEVDPVLVDFCRSIFLDVTRRTAIEALHDEEDDSLGGIAMIQVVEHLTAQELVETIECAFRKVMPGGKLVMETVNGTSPFVLTRSFYCDPTHTNPVHHEYLQFVCEQIGFRSVEVSWRSPVAEADKLTPLAAAEGKQPTAAERRLQTEINQRIDQLNQHLFGAQDYLIVATR